MTKLKKKWSLKSLALMIEKKYNTNNIILKKIILVLSILLLINPVVLFIIFDSIIIGICIPLATILLTFVLYQNKKTKPLSVLLFNVIFVLSLFLHAEAIFTANFSDYIIENLYEPKENYYFNLPYLKKTFRDKEFVVQYFTNRQGFRISSEDEPEISVTQVDWLFIGDSYTQGAQVQYEDLYTTKLYKSFPDKTILNAGISGWGLPEEFNYYKIEGKKYKPSKVILQVCNFNDFMNVKERKTGFSDYLMAHSNFARYLLYDLKYANPAELPLGRWVEPFYPSDKLNEEYNIFYKSSSEKKLEDLKNFAFYLKQLNTEVTKNGSDLIVIQIPTKEQVSYKYFEEVINGFKIDVSKLDMNFPNKFLDSICKENKIKHIDLLHDFADSEQELFYQYDEHLNAIGHQQIANSIKNFLGAGGNSFTWYQSFSEHNTADRYPNFSITKNNLLAFQSIRDNNLELFIGDSLLNSSQRLTWNDVDEIHPSLSPDNLQIVFTEGNQESNRTKVAIMNLDGSERRYITDKENLFGAIPSFSHDGLKVSYAEWREDKKNGDLSNSYIVIKELSTGKKIKITSETFESWRPIFSPDGRFLFFISKMNENQFDIYSFDLITNEIKNLTNTNYDEWDPAISRDGRFLAYSGKLNNNWDLFILDFSTSNKKQLTSSLGDEWDPSFSPDGKTLYFAGTFGLHNGIYRIGLK
ncbi:MAG: hypothetical protein E6H07_13100 [Bacteroidetes bacterium]|nr:MAG: hypothetical protein E6H07_13100 [Bacteroidota bacterium]